LQAANRRLQEYAQQIERLTAARERNRLARELHDSVTQTVFSMTMTTQSALLLLDREPARVGAQLDRLSDLANSALAEMQTLVAELRPEVAGQAGLAAALRQHLGGRPLPEGLAVSLEVEGDRPLVPTEEQSLFRIAQEALNNVVKHAHASRVTLHLHLTERPWLEIGDDGQGFDPQQVDGQGGIGLSSMRERAAEIGWNLRVLTGPGAGTRIRVEKEASDADR
jgi:signal transduction histidine kinase